MTHEEVFLQDILNTQDDDTPRRIFADWLMDRGSALDAARGEFIHIQCDLARFGPDTPRPRHLVLRERELLAAHGREWGSALLRLGCRCWEYRRGFLSGIGLTASTLISHASTLYRLAPTLREIKLYEASGLLSEIAACPFLTNIHILDLENNDLSDLDLVALAGPNRLTELRSLMLWSNRISDSGLRIFVAKPPPQLDTLDLSSNVIGDVGAAALADAPACGRLRRLNLRSNRIGSAGALSLARSPYATTLAHLYLTNNPLGFEGSAALRMAFGDRVHLVH
ncbi:MAG: TIGR02996 domain-containing protein [Planctomycetia bacterium]|nr:TIGR02996 domain-containing protein [Planctomycetia bacterium]